MNLSIENIQCKEYDKYTKMKKVFRVAKYTFNYLSDKDDRLLLDTIILKGTELAGKVNSGAANDSSKKREFEKILNNCIAGILSEFLWKEFLNRESILVEETIFFSSSNQIDLRVVSNDKKIEVRSSFPRNGINFALCHSSHEFDIIGMYSNDYKPMEIQKDYYVRSLFHLGIDRYWQKDEYTKIPIIKKIIEEVRKDGFEAYLTGGASWEMMIDENIAQNKSFIPDDEINMKRLNSKTSYRVVPFSGAHDTIDIYNLIKSEKF